MAYLKSILYLVFFTVLLPLELLMWGQALDAALGGTYLSKRLQLSLFFDLPRGLWITAAVLSAAAMLSASLELGTKSHRRDILLFCGFPLYMLSLFMLYQLPCTMAIGTGLIILTAAAVWFAYPAEDRQPFPLPDDRSVKAGIVHRMTALFLLLGILGCGILIFQEGYQLWLAFKWTPLLVILPLAGVFLPTPGQLREYLAGSLHALVFTALIYGLSQLFAETTIRSDSGIVVSYIFLELVIAQMIRPLLPEVRNSSLIILGLSSLTTYWIMPAICSPWIITLAMYLLYLLIDNRRIIRKKMFSRAHFRHSEVRLLSWEEYAAQAWGFGGLLAAWLAGPQLLKPILLGLGAALLAGIIRSRLINDAKSDHLILEKFPYALEFSALILSAMLCGSWGDSSCAVGGSCRNTVMILLCVYAAASCVMQMIWNIGGLIGRYTPDRPALQFFHIFCQFGIGFLLVLLFLIQAPASVLLGYFCILTGIVKIADKSFMKNDKESGLMAGWVLIVIGQFVFVSAAETILPAPEWSSGAPVCALISCAALYVYRLFDFRNRRNPES